MRRYFVCVCLLVSQINSILAQEKPDLTDARQRMSYALGLDVARGLKADEFDVNLKIVRAGIADTQAGKPAFTPAELKATMKAMQDDILARAVAKKEAAGEVHRKEGQAFLAANARKEGVKIKEVGAPDGSRAELQYKILKSGAFGPSPGKADKVVVKYRGTLIDGTVFDVFDPAIKNGELATFDMSDVIAGWAVALQMMRAGDRWQLFVPPSLAYADYGPPEIGMHTTLIYELELVSFSPANEARTAPNTATPPAR